MNNDTGLQVTIKEMHPKELGDDMVGTERMEIFRRRG